MSDYRLEFLGRIERKSLGWVFRAVDSKNYYVGKLEALGPGPTSPLALTRFAVIGGVEGPHVQRVLAHSPTDAFKVKLEARGGRFTIFVQNQVVEDWQDDRLKAGSVGFLNEREERGKGGVDPVFFPERWSSLMSNSSENWQWVDEDPIEKLLRPAPGPSPAAGSSPETFLARGRAQFARQLFEEAADSFHAAIAAEPRHPTAHFDLAVCLEKLERWQAAADSFRRSLEIDSERWQALVGLGSCLLHLGAAEEALSCFERSVEAGAPEEAVLLGKGSRCRSSGATMKPKELTGRCWTPFPGQSNR